jgi:hypothetical protein
MRQNWAVGRAQAKAAPERRTSVLAGLALWAGRRLPPWRKVRGTLLRLTGLGALDWAAWTVDMTVGLVAVGVSLLLLEWMGDQR